MNKYGSERLHIPGVYFFVPIPEIIQNILPSIEGYWNWINDYISRPEAKFNYDGPFSWTIQTYIFLRLSGFPCKITSLLPEDGIIISHTDFITWDTFPSPKRIIVEIKPDRELKNKFANYVVIQNKNDPVVKGIQRIFIKSFCIDYWPQPSLIPRDIKRGDKFENICFIGNQNELLPELRGLGVIIKNFGLKFKIVQRKKWHDYSDVDAIVAIRPNPYDNPTKPATKLYNAWAAGVPAILDPGSAYRNIRENELDYLEAADLYETLKQIKRLQNDVALRKAMVENGKRRAKEFTTEKITKKWETFLLKDLIPNYIRWKKFPLKRYCFFMTRLSFIFISKIISYKRGGRFTLSSILHFF